MRHPRIQMKGLTFAAILLSAIGLACDSKRESSDTAMNFAVARRAPASMPEVAAAPAIAPAPAPPGEAAGGIATDAAPAIAFGTGSGADPAAVRQAAIRTDAGAMLVRTGTASVQVDSLALGIARVREVARRVGGVVANVDMSAGKEQNPMASLELRIPSDRFDDAVNGLAPIGKVEAVNVSVEDVGEEFVDVSARVTNARKLEARLVDLLGTRTGKLTDVLAVERELARVREEIERYEGRLRYLGARVSTSRLTVALHEPLPLVATHPGEHPILDAFKQAWRNFVAVVAGVVASLGVVIPLGLVILGAWIALRKRIFSAATVKPEG